VCGMQRELPTLLCELHAAWPVGGVVWLALCLLRSVLTYFRPVGRMS
jgi:hypothetical protein